MFTTSVVSGGVRHSHVGLKLPSHTRERVTGTYAEFNQGLLISHRYQTRAWTPDPNPGRVQANILEMMSEFGMGSVVS